MQYQVRYEYNITGKFSNEIDTITQRVTLSWDRLQKQVTCHFVTETAACDSDSMD